METTGQELYTFYGARLEQVDDLCDMWQESLVDWNRALGLVSVESDPISMEQFLLFYKFYEYLENGEPNENLQGVWANLHRGRLQSASCQ